MQNYLCLSIDGLQCGMIGAYGNSWIQTPTLDSLACQSALFDRFYASSLDISQTLQELWQFPLSRYKEYHKVLLTDDADVFVHEQAGLFDEKHQLPPAFLHTKVPQRRGVLKSNPLLHRQRGRIAARRPVDSPINRPAARIEETQFYHNIALLISQLRQRPAKPFFCWIHLRGFRSPWDFPMEYRHRYQIDEDPKSYSKVSLPNITLDKHSNPDVRQSITQAYSGGVSVFDDVLSGLLEFFRAEGLDRNSVFLLLSVRGFSLGEHRYIGVSDDLYGENVHLPMMIRFPHSTGAEQVYAGFRSQTLLQPADVWWLLTGGVSAPDGKYLPDEPDERHLFIRIDRDVIVMPDWFVYRKPAGIELYVKPDDRWEVNDVANRCPHILEEIRFD